MTANDTDNKRPLTDAQRRQRAEAPLKHGLYAGEKNATELRARLGKRVGKMARKEMGVRPWLGPESLPLVRVLCETRIIRAAVLAEITSRGVIGQGGQPRRLLQEHERLTASELRIENALPRSPDVAAGSCDLGAPDWRMPVACIQRFLAYVDEAESAEPMPAPIAPDAALLREAEAILQQTTIEGGQSE